MEQLKPLNLEHIDQLNACKLSLIMGVKGARNQIQISLKIARNILKIQHSLWMFVQEPYAWFANQEQFHPCLCSSKAQQQLLMAYGDDRVVAPNHPHYPKLTEFLHQHGCEHQRAIAISLIVNQQKIGQIIFFDDKTTPFEQTNIDLVIELLTGVLGYVELKFDFAEIKESFEELSALNFSRTKFFQIIAHDLRAPFHGLLGFSEVLAEEIHTLEQADVQSIASYVHDTAKSTYHLLENLLNWAMAEGGHFVYQPINFKLKQATHIVTNVLMSLAKQKNIELIEDIPDDIWVHADINMLTSILQNLTSNALKFTPTNGDGQVSIRARIDGNFVAISVKDTGLGMCKKQLAKVFEPRLKMSLKGTAGEKGTGLGLVLCKRFIDLNHGEISVSSKEGQGTTFVVKMPIALETHTSLQVQPYDLPPVIG